MSTLASLLVRLGIDVGGWGRDTRKASEDYDDLIDRIQDGSNRSAAGFLKLANNLSNIPTAAAGINGAVSIVGSLAGVLGLVPAAAAAAAAAIATVKVGTKGFGDAVTALGDNSKFTAATGGMADAAVQGARRIQSAEESLARAQTAAKDAQDGLSRARAHATEQLEDLKLALSGAALAEEDAQVGLERAQQRLAEAQKAGAKGLDLREAELGVRQAAQSLDEVRERYGDLKQEAAQAAKAGVDGSDVVVAAQKQVAQTAQGVRDAQREVAQAHEDAARGAGKAAAAADKAAQALDKLSPNARSTALAVNSLRGKWEDMQHAVQDSLFDGLAGQVKTLGGTYIPVLQRGMSGVAAEFNTGAHSVAGFLAEGQQVSTITSIFGGTKDIVGNLTDTLKPLLSILLDVVAVGTEMLPGMTGGFGAAAEGAAAFVHNARETGELRQWIQGGLDTLHKLGTLFSQIWQIASAVFHGLSSGGSNFLDTLIRVTAKVRDFLQSVEGQAALKALGTALAAVSAVVTQVMLVALNELAPVIVALAPGFAEFAGIVGGLLVGALQVLGPQLLSLAGFLSDNVQWLGPLAIGLYAAVQAFQAANAAWKIMNALAMMNPWLLLIAATVMLAVLIITHWDKIKEAIGVALGWLGDRMRDIGGLFVSVWEKITGAIDTAVQWIIDRWNALMGFFSGIPEFFTKIGQGIADGIKAGFKSAVNWLIDMVNGLINGTNELIGGINDVNPFSDIPPIPHIPKLAHGGLIDQGGMAVVGERGPELVDLPTGARVFSNHDSQQMLGGGGDITVRVFIGDRELTDIVDVQIEESNRETLRAIGAGVGGAR